MIGTPQDTAEILLKQNFPIAKYERLQEIRRNRLALWKERDIRPLIEMELKLIAFGEEVLNIMNRSRQ